MPLRSGLREKVSGAFLADDKDDAGSPNGLFDGAAAGRGELRRIPLDKITPRSDQPRRSMDAEALDELTASIRERGVLQPIRVRAKEDGDYEIIAGERRWTAAAQADLREIPAVIVTANDDQAYLEALIENIQREDLNSVDRAHALKQLRVNLGTHSWEEVGRVIGISRRHVYHLLNITRLPEPIQEDIRVGDLTEKHGRALLRLQASPEEQALLWERIHSEHLSGDAAVALAGQLRPSNGQRRRGHSDDDATPPATELSTAIDTLVTALARAGVEDVRASHHRLEELAASISRALTPAAGNGDADAAPVS